MANICVRGTADVTFDGDGTTWAAAASGGAVGARKGMPTTKVRGNTYYVADGAYSGSIGSGFDLDTAASGTTLITIKKATVTDHGTSTGWSDAFGDGTATITGSIRYYTDYWLVDGQTRNESDWTSQVYGFRVTQSVVSWPDNFPPGGDHCTTLHCDIGGTVGTSYGDPGFSTDEPVYFVRNSGSTSITDMTVSKCYIHNCTILRASQLDTYEISYCYMDAMWAKEAFRGDVVCKNGTIKFNVFKNTTQDTGLPGEGGTAPIAIWDFDLGAGSFDNNQIYGNIFWDTLGTTHSAGVIILGGGYGGFPGVVANNSKVYNNTIVGFTGEFNADISFGASGTGNEVINNLWYDCIGTPAVNNADTESNNGETASNIFVNATTGNFRLTTNSAAGTTLGSPYNVDMDGVTRGTGGNWSRGAFQYVAGGGGAGTLNVTTANITTLTVGA